MVSNDKGTHELIDEIARQQQIREIELELIRVRAGAEAARLDARAAELELLLRRMAAGSDIDQARISVATAERVHSEPPALAEGDAESTNPPNRWSSRISRMQSRDNCVPLPSFNSLDSAQTTPIDLHANQGPSTFIHPEPYGEGIWQRSDPGSNAIRTPHFSDRTAAVVEEHDKTPLTKPIAKSKDATSVIASLAPKVKSPTVPLPAIQPINSEEAETKRRFRPASFLVSTLAHVVVLILLGVATLATKQPKDQLAFTSSATESSEETMETFAIESNEPMEETEPIPTESAYEISTVGTIAVTEVSMDIPPAPTPPTTSDFLNSSSSSLSSSAMKSLKSDTKMKSQFCGVDGGGSHFVYLVDSSGSMRDGFQSARTELLASIDQLKPDQRFYVVFFDEEPNYMRISDPSADESASVMATPENKQRLRKWAMSVEMNKGKAPYDILPFALTLRPDVIFLLSDGEFPVKIEEILREQNRQENLFGESGLISIVHTIRYHGIEGETGRKAEETMIKIAKENGGQYRHVPKPK